MTFDKKYSEIKEYIDNFNNNITYKIIVQHFCIETWALGNKKIVKKSPKNETVKKYKKIFDVLKEDPEKLPENKEENLNRSQFANKYLRKLLNEQYKNLTYTKSNPQVLLHNKYYERVKDRMEKTGHINSFQKFIDVFSTI